MRRQRRRKLPPKPIPPKGYMWDPYNHELIIRICDMESQARAFMSFNRSLSEDPSYFWAEQVKEKRRCSNR